MDKTLKAILELEEKTDCNREEIDGFQFWNYERFYIWQSVEEMIRDEDVDKKNSLCEKMNAAKKYLSYLFTKKSRFRKGKVDVLFMPHPRRFYANGKYQCMYSGDLMTRYENVLTLENFYEKGHLEPVAEENIIYLDRVIFKAIFYSMLCAKVKRRKNREIAKCVRPYAMKVYEALDMSSAEIKERISRVSRRAVKDYYVYKVVMPYMRRLLEEVSPKAVVEVVHYSKYWMMMTETCHRMGIPVIELQHGYGGDNHTALNYGKQQYIKQFPDYFLKFSDFHCRGVKFPISQENIISVGFSFFDTKVKSIKWDDRREKGILFISHALKGEKMAKIAVDLSNMPGMDEYRIIYKMHPVEFEIWKELYPELIHSKIEIFDDFSKDIYDCFGMTYLQIGVSSTAIYEGLGVGMETLILQDDQSWWMNEVIEQGYAKEIHNAEEIYQYINGTIAKTKIDRDYFFKPDATNNMVRVINEIMNRPGK